jgi:hypothetical protein
MDFMIESIKINIKELDFNNMDELPYPSKMVPTYFVLTQYFSGYIANGLMEKISEVTEFYEEKLFENYGTRIPEENDIKDSIEKVLRNYFTESMVDQLTIQIMLDYCKPNEKRKT